MSVSCATFPTLTATNIITTVTVSTTSTPSTTTNPPTTTTTVTRTCSAPAGVTSTCIPTDTPVTITLPGEVTVVQVPMITTIDITSTNFNTLFGTSCVTITRPNDTPPPITTPPPPPPVVTSISSSTQPNGSVIIVTKTETATATSDGGQQTTINDPKNDDNSPPLAPIIGGVVGGFFGLIAIVAIVWFILKRRRRWDDIFEKEENDIVPPPAGNQRHGRRGRFSLDVDVEPKPYQYGLVGQALPPAPASPPLLPSMATSADSHASQHGRHRSSLTPLNLSVPLSTPGPSLSTASSRPSTAGSMQPLYPSAQHGQQQPARSDIGRAPSAAPTSNSHTQSITSATSPPMSLSNWSASASSGTGPTMGMSMGMSSDDHSYFNRSGSPISIQEQPARRLQVANAPPLSSASDTFPFSDPLVLSSGAVVHEAVAPQRDGKGRLRMSTGKAPLVHLDGGRLQQAEASTSGPSPPAYVA